MKEISWAITMLLCGIPPAIKWKWNRFLGCLRATEEDRLLDSNNGWRLRNVITHDYAYTWCPLVVVAATLVRLG